MKTSKIVYTGGLRTKAIHLKSQQEIITDAPVDNNGKGEAFSPTDLMSTSLGCCMVTIMGILAERKGWNIEGTELEITKIMGTEPRRVTGIRVEISVPARSFSEKEKQMLENAAKTCPVAFSLHPELEQDISFVWVK
ncbi:MAG: OsmC family protein [Bacteroidia bacterium]|nr:OsmC family protein [Bacteroidia bacterium]